MSPSIEHALPGLLGTLYSSVFEPDGVQHFFSDLCRSFDEARGLFYVFDAETQSTPRFLSFGMAEDAEAAYRQHFVALNPYPLAAFEKSRVGTVIRSIDVLPAEAVARTEFVADWMVPQGIGEHHFGAMLQRDMAGMALLAICPPEARTRASLDTYVEPFQKLTPHIMRAFELARHCRNLSGKSPLSPNLLDVFDVAAVLLDEHQRVIEFNARSAPLFEGSGPATPASGGMRNGHPAQKKIGALSTRAPFRLFNAKDDAALKAAIVTVATATARRDAPVPPSCLRIETPIYPMIVWVLGLREEVRGEHALACLFGKRSAVRTLLLFVRPDQAQGAVIAPQSLRALFGLTPAEAEVAVRIASGLTLEAAAGELDISRTTARNHLARVMSKMGIGRQAELAALVASLRPSISLRR